MRRDIQHWERALELAAQIAPDELPYIAKEVNFKYFIMSKVKNVKMKCQNAKKLKSFKMSHGQNARKIKKFKMSKKKNVESSKY